MKKLRENDDLLLFNTDSNIGDDNIRKKNTSVFVSRSGEPAHKGQPCIIVSHLWAFVPGPSCHISPPC